MATWHRLCTRAVFFCITVTRADSGARIAPRHLLPGPHAFWTDNGDYIFSCDMRSTSSIEQKRIPFLWSCYLCLRNDCCHVFCYYIRIYLVFLCGASELIDLRVYTPEQENKTPLPLNNKSPCLPPAN